MKHNLYIHSKTKCIYNVLFIGTHTESEEKLVVYQRLKLTDKTPQNIWIRPLDMFMGDIINNGQLEKRFKKMDDSFNNIKTHSELIKKIKKYCEENNLIFE